MNIRLFDVSRAFQMGDTPTVVEPGPLTSVVESPGDVEVEIRRPDGTVTWAMLTLSFRLPASADDQTRYLSVFRNLKPGEVPEGSQIWCSVGRS